MFHYIHTFIMFKHVNFGKHVWIHTSKIKKKHTHFKISSRDEVFTRLFFFFFYPAMKFHLGKNVSTVKGCLHVKFHPGMKLVPGRNHPCPWRNVSYCLHLFLQYCGWFVNGCERKPRQKKRNIRLIQMM